MIATRLLRALALVASLALLCIAPARADTTAVTLSSSAWTDLGAGPVQISASGGTVLYQVATSQPSNTTTGTPLANGSAVPLQVTGHVWAKSTSGAPSALVTPITSWGGAGALTANQGTPGASPWPMTGNVGGSYFYNVASTVLTRASNTTTYTANTTVCAYASTTPCAPITVSIAATNAGQGTITGFRLLKSSSTTTNATFTAWLYSASPSVSSPAQYDNVAYSGPRAVSVPNYIGSATCSTPVATSDTSAQVWYECTLNNPNAGGTLVFQALAGSTNIDIFLSVTAAYAPASAETFVAYVSGWY